MYRRCYSLRCGPRYENYGGHCVRREGQSLRSSQHSCSAKERVLHAWHVVEENNGTIVDIRSKNIYHQEDYKVTDVEGEEVFVVCDEEEQAEGAIIYFDSVQIILSNVLTSVSLVCMLLHILVHSSLKKLRQSQPAKSLLSLVCALFVGQLLFFFGMGEYFAVRSVR